jgi:hypothetical protein
MVMEVEMIIREIQQLPLSKKLIVMKQTLKSIKKEELKHKTEIEVDELYDEYTGDKEIIDSSYLVSEKSLADDWLSEEDDRWDKLL